MTERLILDISSLFEVTTSLDIPLIYRHDKNARTLPKKEPS